MFNLSFRPSKDLLRLQKTENANRFKNGIIERPLHQAMGKSHHKRIIEKCTVVDAVSNTVITVCKATLWIANAIGITYLLVKALIDGF